MKKRSLGWKVWTTYGVLSLLPLVVTAVAVVWFLPEKIPVHYNAEGLVDRWGSKWECFLLPVIILPFGGLLLGCAKAASLEPWEGTGRRMVLTCGVVGLLLFQEINYFFLYTSLVQIEDLKTVPQIGLKMLFLVLGLALVALGGLLPLGKPNAWFGVRTKWTLADPLVWEKTQRRGGWFFAAAGVLDLVALALPIWGTVVVCILTGMGAIVFSVLYSQREGKKKLY